MPTREYERLGLDDVFYEILGLRVPLIRMPVAPGRNIAILVEVAARNQLLRVARPPRGARARRAPRGSRCVRRRRWPSHRRRRRGTRAGRRRRWPAAPGSGDERQQRPEGGQDEPVGRAGKARSDRGPAVHRPHRAVRVGQVAGDSRARGSRLLLRRQPADDADPDAGQAVAARRRRHREGRDRRRRARGRLPVVVPEDLPAAAEDAAAEPGADLPRGEPRGAGAAVQRDAAAASAGADRSVSEGIRDERSRLNVIRDLADEIVDTSDMTVHELRQFFMGLSRERSRARLVDHAAQLRLQARRAGRRRSGVRRALPAEPAFRARRCAAGPAATGRSPSSWSATASTREFMDRLEDYLRYVVPFYVAEGKSYLTIAIGCTGGRHRSVMIAERLRRALARPCGVAPGARAAPGYGGTAVSRPGRIGPAHPPAPTWPTIDSCDWRRRRHPRAARDRAGQRGRDDRRRPAAVHRRSRSAGTTTSTTRGRTSRRRSSGCAARKACCC